MSRGAQEKELRLLVGATKSVARVSPEKILLMMDPEQPLKLRFTLAQSLLPIFVALMRWSARVPIVDKTDVIDCVKRYLSAIDPRAPEILETSCFNAYGKRCEDLNPLDMVMLPYAMLKQGVRLDIVVETMTMLYATLAYMFRIVTPELAMAHMISALEKAEERAGVAEFG
jgi:hypothetical protein